MRATFRLFLILIGVLVGAVATSPAKAAGIVLGINGTLQITSNSIEFGQFASGGPYAVPPGYGTVDIPIARSVLAALAGTTGSIQSLNITTGPETLPAPLMTFSADPNLVVSLTGIPAGADGFFTPTDTPNGAILSFNVDGNLMDVATGQTITPLYGTFSMTFAGETASQVLSGPFPIATPFSATFSDTPVPEPAALGILCLGLAAAFPRRRTQTA